MRDGDALNRNTLSDGVDGASNIIGPVPQV